MFAGLLLPRLALAEDALNGADTAWIMTSTALVLFMTLPGLALFYGGLVRDKNVLSVLLQCFGIAGMVSIVWLALGYSLAFGEGNAWIGDFSKVMFAGIGKDTLSGTIPESLFALFQMTFAIITPALIVGGTLGTLLAGVFSATSLGIFSGYGFAEDKGIESMGGQLWVQFVGVASAVIYTAVATWVILKVVSVLTKGLRVGEEQEIEGLDIASHEERGYDLH